MKDILVIAAFCLFACSCDKNTDIWIRINQVGYRPDDIKIAVLISTGEKIINKFTIEDLSGQTVLTSDKIFRAPALDQFVSCYRLDLSELTTPGSYRISAGNVLSPDFTIGEDVYAGAAGYLLNYMRQQRCGFNPFLRDSCHTHDGYEMYGNGDSAHIDVTGGWHDAADYLQYVATSANAVYQMLFAWSENPDSFRDEYLANGLPGSDGIADVLNESRWGLEWLLKMNPGDEIMYNQIADDRDHVGFRLPVGDRADYGKGNERPVYLCTGMPQGLFKYTNRTTGIASTAGKFASAFAIASRVYMHNDPAFSSLLLNKAEAAFRYGLKNPGVCQTAPGRAPYFYEEDNWSDDMELAAAELYNVTGERRYLEMAIEFGRQEPVTPWMGADTARHYQWYPFVNMGHPVIARHTDDPAGHAAAGFMKEGLDRIRAKAAGNPFNIGVPFIWCSNNLVAAFLTQARLYSEITGDNSYAELEASHRDWLFGCNPWGTSMIVGLPQYGDYPENTHSSYVIRGEQVWGGLVDGPVYQSIFNAHSKYVSLQGEDQYAAFQTSMANYHDDIGDYTSNECTMDGTACLVYYFSELEGRNGN
jgi:endoglucanase